MRWWLVPACLMTAMGPQAAASQGFGGAWTAAGAAPVALVLEENAENIVRGRLEMDGAVWDVAGIREGEALLCEVYPSGDDGAPARYILRAEAAGAGLGVMLVAVDPDGTPAPGSRRDLVLERPGAAAPVPPASGAGAGGAAPGPGAAGFGGAWTGEILGTATTLTLAEAGAAVTGDVDAGGYAYRLEGRLENGAVTGSFSDPATGGAWEFELARSAEGLLLTLLAPDPNTGAIQRVPFTFVAAGTETAAAPPKAAGTASDASASRDPMLVGRWFWTETYVSGDFTAVTQKTLILQPDGRFVLGDGKIAGGGNAGSFEGGGGGVEATGEWKTEGGVVHVWDEGTAQWSPYARYHVEGGSLMFTFGDGSRKLWSRN